MNIAAKFKQNMAEFQALDAKDKKRAVGDGLINNAIYILLVIFVIIHGAATTASFPYLMERYCKNMGELWRFS